MTVLQSRKIDWEDATFFTAETACQFAHELLTDEGLQGVFEVGITSFFGDGYLVTAKADDGSKQASFRSFKEFDEWLKTLV